MVVRRRLRVEFRCFPKDAFDRGILAGELSYGGHGDEVGYKNRANVCRMLSCYHVREW
jgi:hypothetical protein